MKTSKMPEPVKQSIAAAEAVWVVLPQFYHRCALCNIFKNDCWDVVQSQIEQTWLSNRLEAVIGRQVEAGHEVPFYFCPIFVFAL